MKKIYDLCNMTSQQLFNLYERIKNGKYHTIQIFDRVYYNENKYVEKSINIIQGDNLKKLINNIKSIEFYGIELKNNYVLNGRYIKVWY